MKEKQNNLVTKIAFIVAIVALLFSVVTLVRAIIIGTGVLLAVIQVVGTALIVTICAVMLYVLSANGDEEEDDENEDEEDDEENDEESEIDEDPQLPGDDIDTALTDIDDAIDSYDLSNFEE